MRHPADLAEDFTLQFFFFSTILNDLDWWAVLRHHGERLRLGLIDGWWCFGIIAMMILSLPLRPSPLHRRPHATGVPHERAACLELVVVCFNNSTPLATGAASAVTA
jgi:hypothetical protein